MDIATQMRIAAKTAKHPDLADTSFRNKKLVIRNITVFQSALEGVSGRDIGAQVGVTQCRVSAIIAEMARAMLSPKRLDETAPRHEYHRITEIRKHKDFWLRRLELFKAELKIDSASVVPFAPKKVVKSSTSYCLTKAEIDPKHPLAAPLSSNWFIWRTKKVSVLLLPYERIHDWDKNFRNNLIEVPISLVLNAVLPAN